MKKWIVSVLLAWLIFIGIDFFFHASLLAPLWTEEIEAIKPEQELFRLIPYGYLAFLLQVILIAYLFHHFFPEKTAISRVIKFGVILGILLAAGNLLALHSYVAIPLKQLTVFNGVLFIEILSTAIALYYLRYSTKRRRAAWVSLGIFSLLVIVGIALQNL